MTEMQPVAALPQSPPPGAEWMRRPRERGRDGRVCFLFELYPGDISGLVELVGSRAAGGMTRLRS